MHDNVQSSHCIIWLGVCLPSGSHCRLQEIWLSLPICELLCHAIYNCTWPSCIMMYIKFPTSLWISLCINILYTHVRFGILSAFSNCIYSRKICPPLRSKWWLYPIHMARNHWNCNVGYNRFIEYVYRIYCVYVIICVIHTVSSTWFWVSLLCF